MVEPSKEASQRQRRANWVGLRTLRQRPKMVGATDDGEPIYEVRSVRLVLLGTSPHFNRVAPCSRCGRELPGAPVMTLADLDMELRPMISADCVRGTGVTSVWDPEAARRVARGQGSDVEGGADLAPPGAGVPPLGPGTPAAQAVPAAAPAAQAVPAAAPAVVSPGPAGRAVPEDRVAAMERHLRAVTARLNELGQLAAAQQAQAEERQRRDADAAAAREAMLDQALAEIRAALASRAEERATGVEALEEQMKEAVSGLGQLVAAQRADLATVVAKVSESGAEVERLAQTIEEREGADYTLESRAVEVAALIAPAVPVSDLDRRLDELAAAQRAELASLTARLSETSADVERLSQATEELARAYEVLAHRLAEAPAPAAAAAGLVSDLERRLDELIAGRGADVASVTARLSETDAEVRRLAQATEALERRVAEAPEPAAADDLDRLEELAAGQRAELDAAIDASVGIHTAGLVRANDELAGEQTVLDRRLEELARHLEGVARRLEELVAWTGLVGERLDVVEKGLQQALRARPRPAPAPVRNAEAMDPSPSRPPAAPPGSLIDSLDRQLEAAADRLAARFEADPG